jgi:2-keto-4-pentenoate hydratase/2-oxohepta-3-ene-1,7-dioic acid hydratase in catechol pathway
VPLGVRLTGGTIRQKSEIPMKLMRFSRKNEPAALSRLGVLIGADLVADLRAGYALYLVDEAGNPKGPELAQLYMPPYIAQFLHIGEPAWRALGDAYTYLADLAPNAPEALGLAGERLFVPLSECRLYAPVRPSKLITVALNYPRHAALSERTVGDLPHAAVKTLSALTGPERDIVRPRHCRELDFETELAVVIGRKCKNVPEVEAYSYVAGYTILNDVNARDIGARERAGGNVFLAKTFDTFAPTGPWMVTREAIPDPMRLRIQTRVNGEQRQDGNTHEMIHSISKLISYMSQITLMPGDIIATGSPGGGGLSNPDWLLKAGDVVECEIEGIGILRNAVVDESEG